MFVRLLTESVRRGARRRLLAAVAVAVGVLTATALAEVLLASGDRLAADLGSYGANIEVLPADGADSFDAAELTAVRNIFWRNNVVAVAPTVEVNVRFAGDDVDPLHVDPLHVTPLHVAPLVGTWFEVAMDDELVTGLPQVRPTLATDGRWPADDVGSGEVALGRRLAARLGAATGDRVTVSLGDRSRQLAVVGVVTSGGDEEERAFAPLALVAALAGREPVTAAGDGGPIPGGLVTRAEVFALTNPELENRKPVAAMTPQEYDLWYCTAYPSSVAFQIEEAIDGTRAGVVPAITGATRDLLGKLRAVLLAVAIVSLAGAALAVAAVMTATVLERRLEAGLMLALGGESWKVAGFFLAEAALVGFAGGLAGALAGLALGRPLGGLIFGVEVPWTPVLLPLGVAAGMAIAVAGSALPVLRLFQGRPALQLRRATA
ncbi:MAG TPA: ABC transporter permease [Thermoanaerobaculia bacterium]|nr:ABC transporter permease [Thermoanaerobaculia bacterium]